MSALSTKTCAVFFTQCRHWKIQEYMLTYRLGQVQQMVTVDGEHFILIGSRKWHTRYHIHRRVKALFKCHMHRLLKFSQAACACKLKRQVYPTIHQHTLVCAPHTHMPSKGAEHLEIFIELNGFLVDICFQ